MEAEQTIHSAGQWVKERWPSLGHSAAKHNHLGPKQSYALR